MQGETIAMAPAFPQHVIRRDGVRAPFEAGRIASALARAGAASGELDADEAERLTARVLKVLRHRYEGATPSVEHVQDVVEQALVDANHLVTFRAYVAYRDQHRRLRGDRKTLVDVASTVDEYVGRSDWRVRANANQGYSLGGLILNVSGKVVANYWLSHVSPFKV